MDTPVRHVHALRLPPWALPLPSLAGAAAWMALGATAAFALAVLLDVSISSAALAEASLPGLFAAAATGMAVGAFARGPAGSRAYACGAGAMAALGLAGAGPVLAGAAFAVPLLAVLSRHEPQLRVAAVFFLALAVLSLQAALGAPHPYLVSAIAAAAALPALATVQGTWRGLAFAGTACAVLAAYV